MDSESIIPRLAVARYALEVDPEVAKAADSMPKAQALLNTARKLIAQRSAN